MKVNIGDSMTKMFKGLASHMKKAAEHHLALHKAHGAMHEYMKGKHDGMPDDHEHKAYFGKAAAHHELKASLHKAHADHLHDMSEEMDGESDKAMKAFEAAFGSLTLSDPKTAKTAPAENKPEGETKPAEGEGEGNLNKNLEGLNVDGTVGQLLGNAVKDVATEISKDASFKEIIKEALLKAVKEQFGSQTQPTAVKVNGAITSDAKLIPIARPGQPTLEKSAEEDEEMPAELAHFGGN